MRPLAVLRPEPGNAATAARIAAAGGRALRLPLFVVRPLDWTPPDPAAHDALLLTSANAVRCAGPGLDAVRALPVYAVGAATAAAAAAAGLRVVATGSEDAAALAALAERNGVARALHLAGRERAAATLPGVAATAVVYASVPRALVPAERAALTGCVALVHSPRAAGRLAALIAERETIALAAISAAAAAAAGPGWRRIAVAAGPDDAAVVAAGLELAGARPSAPDRPGGRPPD